MNKYDKRRKYWLVLDCETATLPDAMAYEGAARQKVSIAKPLIYDLGWTVVDAQGRIYAKKNFLIAEIFSNLVVFNTAYYKDKRPLYLEKIAQGEISVVMWEQAIEELISDMVQCEAVGAYNAMFDFKKALPFTDLYLSKVYSSDFQDWLNFQKSVMADIASGERYDSNKDFEPEVFRFRGQVFPLFDVWGLSCQHIMNTDEYKEMCIDNGWVTSSGKYFKTSAETAFRFVSKDTLFDEAHTALLDAEIESFLFGKIMEKTKKKIQYGIIYFPFKELGLVSDYME